MVEVVKAKVLMLLSSSEKEFDEMRDDFWTGFFSIFFKFIKNGGSKTCYIFQIEGIQVNGGVQLSGKLPRYMYVTRWNLKCEMLYIVTDGTRCWHKRHMVCFELRLVVAAIFLAYSLRACEYLHHEIELLATNSGMVSNLLMWATVYVYIQARPVLDCWRGLCMLFGGPV